MPSKPGASDLPLTGESLQPAYRSPISFFHLPRELRDKIYESSFVPTHQINPNYWHYIVYTDHALPITLLLTNKLMNMEATDKYYHIVFARFNITNVAPLCWEKEFYVRRLFQEPWTKRAVVAPAAGKIRHWCLHLSRLWQYEEHRKNRQNKRIDGIVSQLQKSANIRLLVISIPCLCSQDYEGHGDRKAKYTMQTWTKIILPVLQRFSTLHIGGVVYFVPCRMDGFPPCPLRKCKALVDLLDDIANTMEGRTSTATANQKHASKARKELAGQKLVGMIPALGQSGGTTTASKSSKRAVFQYSDAVGNLLYLPSDICEPDATDAEESELELTDGHCWIRVSRDRTIKPAKMEVELVLRDKQMSQSFLGIQIDAVYHTALVLGGIEYFFGAGIQQTYPGATHHGRPMEIVPLGKTDLPIEVILEYLDSLRGIYTMESYDLFTHNCNNFTNDFAMFMLGKGIPDRITSLPQTVLNTPFGQMLKPQLDNAMRGITQAPVAPSAIPPQARQSSASNGTGSSHPSVGQTKPGHVNGLNSINGFPTGQVHYATTLEKLDLLLESAKSSCAVIFFTSATCPPCKLVYPAYDELAAEAGVKAVLIKVDLSEAYEIGSKYQVRATPTFMSFLKGEKENEWVGASESQLRGNVRMLVQMAHPPHPHTNLRLRTLQRRHKAHLYTKIPPLEKLIAKMGPRGSDSAVAALKEFIYTREASGASDAPLPSLPAIVAFVKESLEVMPPDTAFPVIDLLRCALVDQRVSGYLATGQSIIRNI
ncbi:MAG: hypothetical protein Q9218_007794, partial [Villophora microphyllina]